MADVPLPEPAPPHSLPEWSECALRVGNSNFLEKRQREGGYGPEADSKLATQLHRFIYEYDDADPYRSAWFMHRLELMLTEHAAAVTAAKDAEIAALRAEVAGLRAWLEADARCPCCDTTDACVEGCTFATDCPQDAERMAEVRALLAARKGEA